VTVERNAALADAWARVAGKSGYIHLERRDPGILIVTLNRPSVLNALTYDMLDAFGLLWRTAGDDNWVRTVLVTGAGRAFCSGNDLRNKEPDHSMIRELMGDVLANARGMIGLDKPIVAALNGAAVGFGLQLAIMADVCIAAEDAVLIDGQTRLAVTSGDQSALLWPLLCGLARTKMHLFDLCGLTGKEAEEIGLVAKAVPRAQVMDHALAIADRLAAMSQVALRGTKRSLNGWLWRSMPIFESAQSQTMVDLHHADVQEARLALRELRSPDFPSDRKLP